VDKWRSKTVINSDNHPNFMNEAISLSLKRIEDYMRIDLWRE
jgi:hypothetical protein